MKNFDLKRNSTFFDRRHNSLGRKHLHFLLLKIKPFNLLEEIYELIISNIDKKLKI